MAQIIDMPKLSDTMTVGTLVKWLKNEGDAVKSGDMLAEVETDKATMELESFFDGTVLKHFAAAGSQVAIGDPLCAIGEPGEKVDAPANKSAPAAAAPAEKAEKKDTAAPTPATSKTEEKAAKTPTSATEKPEDKPAPSAPAGTSKSAAVPEGGAGAGPAAASSKPAADAPAATGGERIKISPLARKLALELGVNPTGVKGSGPGGRIVRVDIEAAAKAPKPAAGAPSGGGKSKAPAAPFVGTTDAPVQQEKVTKNSNMRATIARRLIEAKTSIPHFYLETEIDAAPMLALRAQVNDVVGDAGKLSVNDFILKACAHALRRVPAVNCSWEGESIKAHAAANVSFAVAIEDGLITPVIFNAHAKTIHQISAEAKTLGAKAKAKKLQPNEYTGGTFCVSNLGMFGVHRFSAIINPPNAAILAVGTTVKKPVVNDAGQIVPGERLALTLSCDHRVVDGATGAQFLAALKEILERPVSVLF
jgi:pyruvate dehydrogenase E2 component (dihydrolipoamide acetyltransferase)